jgi:hypothetical protein
MKLSFAASLALLSAASASSSSGSGGLRSHRRLNLFQNPEEAEKAVKKNRTANAKSNKESVTDEIKGKGNAEKEGKSKSGKSQSTEFLKVEADRPYNGIDTTTYDEYYFGEDIEGTIELTDEYITAAVQEYLNMTYVEEFQVALYPLMGRPQCGQSDPITTATPEFPVDSDGNIEFASGTFTIPTEKKFKKEGQGFDIYVIDENLCEVLGPKKVTLTLTPEEEKEEIDAAKAKAEDESPMKAYSGKAGKVTPGEAKTNYKKPKKEKTNDKEKMNVQVKEALATSDYSLETDKDEYLRGEVINVEYSLANLLATGRRLKKHANKDKKAKDDENNPEPIPEPIPEEELPTQPDPVPQVVDLEEQEFEEEDAPGEQQPELEPIDMAPEEEEAVIDSSDITLYSICVFMKMSHPQGGTLDAILKEPLCPPDKASCSPEEISSGIIEVSTTDLDLLEFGTGFDIWICDGSGDGVAGPAFVTIE